MSVKTRAAKAISRVFRGKRIKKFSRHRSDIKMYRTERGTLKEAAAKVRSNNMDQAYMQSEASTRYWNGPPSRREGLLLLGAAAYGGGIWGGMKYNPNRTKKGMSKRLAGIENKLGLKANKSRKLY